MPERQPEAAFSKLRQWLAAECDSQLPDAQLVARFIANREEAAFAALVRRHGSMVRGVCQSVLHQAQDAEDACQATFLVLAKKAGSIRKKTSVACWLHGVAYRLARKLKRRQRRAAAGQAERPAPDNPVDELTWREVRQIVHEELERLPEKYRQPLILFYLEGRTHEEAARQLGWTHGTLRGMLRRGREMLRQRLTRRGLALTAPLFVGALIPGTAGVTLAQTIARSAVSFVSGKPLGTGISVQAIALAKGGLSAMTMTKLTVAATLITTLSVLAGGAGLATFQAREGEQPVAAQREKSKMPPVVQEKGSQAKEEMKPRVDFHGDPLPEGAIARMGTTRFLQSAGGYHFPIAYTPDGKQLISIDGGKALVFWEATTGKELRRIKVPQTDILYTFVLSPDGNTIATVCSEYPNVRVWDVGSGKPVHQITHKVLRTEKIAENPASVVFTPDSKMLAVSKGDGAIRMWDTSTWQEMATLPKGGSTLQVPSVGVPNYHFLPDGKTLISGWDGTSYKGLTWLNRSTGDRIRRLDIEPAAFYGWSLALSPDGKRLAAVVKPNFLCIWNATTGEEISRMEIEYTKKATKGFPQSEGPRCVLCFSRDSNSLACNVANTNTMILFAADNGKELQRWSSGGRVDSLAFSPDASTLALSDRIVIDLRQVKTGKTAFSLPRLTDSVTWVAFGDGNKTLMTGCRNGDLSQWGALTGKLQQVYQTPPDQFRPDTQALFATVFTPDGKKAVSSNADDMLYVWEPTTGRVACHIEDGRHRGLAPVFSPDSKLLAAQFKDDVAGVWDTFTGKLRYAFPKAISVFRRAFSGDSRQLATAAITYNNAPREKSIRVWNAATGDMEKQLNWDDNTSVWHLAFVPGAPRLLSYHALWSEEPIPVNGSLRLWDLATAREISRTAAPQEFSRWTAESSIVLSPDFKTVGMVTPDGAILSEWTTGKVRARFGGHRHDVFSLALSDDGRLLASGSGDYTALVWDVTGISPDGKLPSLDLTAPELARVWTDLGDVDAAKAYRAMWTMVAAGRHSVPFLAERMRPIALPDAQRVVKLIADLDSDQFKVREVATKELQQIGELAEPAMRKALAGTPTLEARQRLELLLDEQRNRPWSSERLQVLRAVEAMENLGTPEARQLLESLAKGAPGAMQTKEAAASLNRLQVRTHK
jgi:RNA polymerase sigma factor (sigma-70 family)